MKTSELISILLKQVDRHGDLNIKVRNEDGATSDIGGSFLFCHESDEYFLIRTVEEVNDAKNY